MSRPLLIRCRLRAYILDRCKHWGLSPKRVPTAVIDALADDFAKQVDVRVCGMMNKPAPVPKAPSPPRLKKARIYKRSLRGQPSLL